MTGFIVRHAELVSASKRWDP